MEALIGLFSGAIVLTGFLIGIAILGFVMYVSVKLTGKVMEGSPHKKYWQIGAGVAAFMYSVLGGGAVLLAAYVVKKLDDKPSNKDKNEAA
jgi:hypothetical protein